MARSVNWQVWGIAVVVAAVIAGAVVGIRLAAAGQRKPAWWECREARAPDVGAAVPVAGKLVVAEQGFSWTDRTDFSFGASVANNSKKVAYRTGVVVRLLGSNGRPVWQGSLEIPVILPGQRAAVGVDGWLHLDEAAEVARVAVELDTTHWVAVDEKNLLFKQPNYYLSTGPGGAGGSPSPAAEPGKPVEMWVAPTGLPVCQGLVERGGGVLFRDASGAIVGGSFAGAKDFCGGSDWGAAVRVGLVPAAANIKRAEMTLYCDLAGARSTTSGTQDNRLN